MKITGGYMAKNSKPVVFIHGLWLHASSWDNWVTLFRESEYEPIAPGWPGDGTTVEKSRQHLEDIADKSINEVTEHYAEIIQGLDQKPIIIGHSFGGLVTQKLFGQGLGVAAIAIDPAQIKGVLPLPLVQLKNAFPVLGNPLNLHKAVMQSKQDFHRGFASAVSEEESNELYDKYVIPAPARPLFQAAVANFVPNSEAKVDVNADRGPLLIIGGGKDGTVPEVVSRAAHKQYRNAQTINDYKVFTDRGHSIPIDSGWREVADYTLAWLKEHSL